jgi:TonB-dependent receptor
MTRKLPALILSLVLLCCSSVLWAQNTATVRGKVVDAATGEPMPGVSVKLKGTNRGVATDLRGEFDLPFAAVGSNTLELSYLGYQNLTQNVTATAGRGELVIIRMQPGAEKSLKEVVVIGTQKEGQAKALNQQRTADNIKNIVSADLIGRFPDVTVGEALQRVPGVNIERDRGEGGVIQMRGAPPSFTTVNINGEQIPGTQNGGQRNQELSVIPVDQLSSMEVVKAITPDLDGDNIGGTIDLKSPVGKTTQWKGKLELGGGYNNIVQKTNFIGRASINKRFFANDKVKNGRLGINAGLSWFETSNGRDRVQYQYQNNYTPIRRNGGAVDTTSFRAPQFYRLRDLENLRRRIGGSFTADYKFSERSSLTFNYMYTQRFDSDEEKRLQFDLGAGSITAPVWSEGADGSILSTGANMRRFTHVREFDVKTNTFNVEGVHRLSKMTVDYNLFTSLADNRNDAGRVYDFRSGGTNSFTARLDGLGTDFLNISDNNKEVNVHDPFRINTFRSFQDRADIIKAQNFSGKINFTLPYQFKGNAAIFKFGGKVREINNDRDREFSEFDYTNRGYVNEAALFASLVSDREDQQFFKNRVRFGPTNDFRRTDAFINRAFAERPDVFAFDSVNLLNQRSQWFYDARERTQAVYAMTRIQFRKLMLLAGLRYEATQVRNITSSVVLRSPVTAVDTLYNRDSTSTANYGLLLPNLHLKYSLGANTNLRAAFTTSFARPNFTDIMPRANENVQNQTVDLGNTGLRPPRSLNFDLLFEHYFKNIGIISGGLFYKRISNFIYTRNFTQDRPVRQFDPVTGTFTTVLLPFNAQQPQNGDVANIYGAEVNIQYNIDKGLFKGVGIFANYTFTQSRANTFDRKGIRLPGQATHTANFALSYEYKKFAIRGMFNFNGAVIRELGPDVVSIGRTTASRNNFATNGDFDQWRADRYQLDVSASYNIGKGFRVYAEFVNLTNRPEAEYLGRIGDRSRPLNIEYFDWWNRFGVSYNF